MRALSRFSIEELATKAGVSRRTVRYYVQRGLLPAPYGLGRGRHYGEEHLAALLQAKMLQERGEDLEGIREILSGPSPAGKDLECDTSMAQGAVRKGRPLRSSPPQRLAPGEGWFRQRVLPGYELHSGAGARPLAAGELAALAEFLRDLLERGGR
jgi:DNA-binding transcriptional MerR regulator